MYVKSVILRGFKSFASATTLRLEPGITCIVGPNGSGKSNVVDALAWVMGEQGAKSLRGGKMEDVVFAGTSRRPPLGRAEVSMTIDNTDGALPIDYTEVTITRTMFRNGGSDYAINGTSCRLLDIQELLSDSGIGREMHVIVGQGQLDQVLRATPEERRGFIEEAAGVLKHRKRKERALRKLETMEGNLTRLGDLTSEIRRQLGPLGRQAQTARRAAGIQAEVRDARLRLLADDIVGATTALDDEIKAEALLVERRRRAEEALAVVTATVDQAERASAETAPALSRAQDLFYAASALAERLQSTHDLAAERVRLMVAEAGEGQRTQTGRGGRDPERLLQQAAAVRDEEAVLAQRVDDARALLVQAEAARSEAEGGHAAEQARIARLLQAAADRREGLARLAGQVAAQRSRIEAAEAEVGRLRDVEASAVSRAHTAEQEFAALEVTITDVEHGEEGLDDAHEKAQERAEAAQGLVTQWQESLRSAQTRVSSLTARCEALEMSLQRKDGAAALLERPEEAGVEGTLSSLITIRPGHEAQIASALGWVGDALVMRSMREGREGLRWLREHEHGQGSIIVPTAVTAERPATDVLPDLHPDARADGALWAHEVIDASSPDLARSLRQQLRGVALVGTAEQALALVGEQAHGDVTAVTREGDVYGPGWMRGGSSAGPSAIEVASALDQARADAASAGAEAERATFEMQRHVDTLAQASAAADAALADLHHNDADMAAVAEQLGQLGSTIRDARAERDRTQAAIAQALASLETAKHDVLGLEERLAQAERAGQPEGMSAPGDATPGAEPSAVGTDLRDELARAAARARSVETEARLALRTAEERVAALAGRAQGLEAAARDEVDARRKALARREQRERESRQAEAVAAAATYLVVQTKAMVRRADQRRVAMAAEQTEREQHLAAARARARELAQEVKDLTTSVHRDEIARAEQRLRIETLHTRAVEELGVDPQSLVREYGPDQPVPQIDSTTGIPASPDAVDDADSDQPAPEQTAAVPFQREEQEKRLRSAERKLASLGRVNPLALEEFAALEERHTYLVGQVDDLRRSSADLMSIVKEVDDRVEQVFAEAFHDTAAQFEGVFERLFPGGEGRLFLTDPDNMLTTGVEVEARPPGKRIKRLSLLSGGERSLTAVALLVAIFKARPSPFYIMDEVEAALDDTNLGRLITLFEELRDSSQLIVITHQKRTMEVADALYGVSMQGDGVTTVISQRLREAQAPSQPERWKPLGTQTTAPRLPAL